MRAIPADQDADLHAIAVPEGAILLPLEQRDGAPRTLAIAALQQALREQQLSMPLGPATDLDNPDRLLLLNRIAIQLVTAGLCSDQLEVPTAPWRDAECAPQLLAAALVDEENAVVQMAGVLTAEQFMAAAAAADASAGSIPLDVEQFEGGLERLLLFVQVLQPAALPRLALQAVSGGLAEAWLSLRELLAGSLPSNPWAELFGAGLEPLAAGAFRSAGQPELAERDASPLMLTVPLGLAPAAVVSGTEVAACVESFSLALATYRRPASAGIAGQEMLRLRLASQLSGDLLPDGLGLTITSGESSQKLVAAGSTELLLDLPASAALLTIAIEYPGRTTLQLPPLSLQSP